jgi:membrane-associated phospholipid phosphatase
MRASLGGPAPLAARVALALAATAVATAIALPARAEPTAPAPLATPWDSLGDDLADAFGNGTNLLLYGGAAVITAGMAFGGGDHAIRVGVERHLVLPGLSDAANYSGYILPAVIAPAIYLTGLIADDRDVAGAGAAAVQALGITLVTTAVLKIGVGRVYPTNGGDPNAPDRLDHPEYAHEFRPFGSVSPLPAWPSGHTSATTAIAAALTAYYPDRVWIPLVGYPVALAIGFGLIDGDRHWTSDVIAGALIGHAIGYSVGRAFRARARGAQGDGALGLQVVPIAGPGLLGAVVGRAW